MISDATSKIRNRKNALYRLMKLQSVRMSYLDLRCEIRDLRPASKFYLMSQISHPTSKLLHQEFKISNIFQGGAGATYNRPKRVFRHMHGQFGLRGDTLIQAAQQSPTAC